MTNFRRGAVQHVRSLMEQCEVPSDKNFKPVARIPPTRYYAASTFQNRSELLRGALWVRYNTLQHVPARIGKTLGRRLVSRSFSTKDEDLRHQLEKDFGNKLRDSLQTESALHQHPFLHKGEWSLEYREGSVHIALMKMIGDRHVTVELRPSQWMMMSRVKGNPATATEHHHHRHHAAQFYTQPQELTDFCVTYRRPDGMGISVLCTTLSSFTVPQSESPRRFFIGNIRCFASEQELHDLMSYNGPEASDLSENLQAVFDAWLSSLGIDGNLCDFIDEIATDKEQREYIRWLDKMRDFFKFGDQKN